METKNDLTKLNNILFRALDRLDDEKIQGERLGAEVARINAISSASKTVIQTINTQMNIEKMKKQGINILDEVGLGNE